VFDCDDTTPALAAAIVVEVVAVVSSSLVVAAVATMVADVAFEADWFELAAVAAMQPVSVNIAATLPAPTSRRERRAG
jgi:hypothetical protein